MQNSGPKRVSRLLKSVWFLIAGLLLLGHTPGLAEPYLRVSKNGVVYYHFNSREPAQPRPEETTSPPDPGQLIPETAAAAPAGHPPAAQANPPATARYLIRFLTKLGFYDTPVVPPFDIGPQWLEPHAEVPATPDPQFMLPEILANAA